MLLSHPKDATLWYALIRRMLLCGLAASVAVGCHVAPAPVTAEAGTDAMLSVDADKEFVTVHWHGPKPAAIKLFALMPHESLAAPPAPIYTGPLEGATLQLLRYSGGRDILFHRFGLPDAQNQPLAASPIHADYGDPEQPSTFNKYGVRMKRTPVNLHKTVAVVGACSK